MNGVGFGSGRGLRGKSESSRFSLVHINTPREGIISVIYLVITITYLFLMDCFSGYTIARFQTKPMLHLHHCHAL